MTNLRPRWGLVTMADEPAQLVLAFIGHHLDLGADAIHLFLDQPQPDVQAALSDLSKCHVIVTDEAYWQEVHGCARPGAQTRRQELNANHVYETCDLDWLVHMDADEFLIPQGNLRTELRYVPEGIGYLLMPTLERAWPADPFPDQIFAGAFRAQLPGRLSVQRHVFGNRAPFTLRGLSGHVRGKSFARTKQGYRMGIHRPMPPTGDEEDDDAIPSLVCNSMELLHFDGLTPLHWMIKRLRYAALPQFRRMTDPRGHRDRQLAHLRDEVQSRRQALRLFRQMQVYDVAEEARLRALGLLVDRSVNLACPVRQIWPDFEVDHSTAAFDLDLRARNQEFLRKLPYRLW
jgi:hypothetical protein